MKKTFTLLCIVCIQVCILHAQSWLLTGNSGTNASSNFIGTTDAKALVFKVNNKQSGYIDFGSAKANTSFGFQALKSATGTNNAAFGYKASFSNSSGDFNTAAGAYALYFNTTGYSNVAIGGGALYKNITGHNVVAVGDSALYNNGVGATFSFQAAGNTALGSKSLYTNTTGYSNTAMGFQSLYQNTTGYENTANGNSALYSNTTGASNTATGYSALRSNTTGFYNAANGARSLESNTTGGNNTATGYQALRFNTTGSNNTATGMGALASNTTGSDNVANGKYALENNTTGNENIAIGTNAMFYNTTGYRNTAAGYYALNHNTSGTWNTAIGTEAMYQNTSGGSNTSIGVAALYGNTTGYYNTAAGNNALTVNTTGYGNAAFGNEALLLNTTGSYNTATGTDALYNNTSSYYNCAFGYLAMAYAIPGYNNTAIGSFAGPAVDLDNLYNTIALGNSAITTASNQARIGNSSTSSIGGYANWTNISDGRVKKNIKNNVPGLAFINKLTPVTYTLDLDAADKITQSAVRKDKAGKAIAPLQHEVNARNAKQQIVYTGFVAQDVERAAKELNYDFSGVDPAKNRKDLYGLRYAEFVVPLVKAVQELDVANKKLEEQNSGLQKQIDDLRALILKLTQDKPASSTETSGSTSIGSIKTPAATLGQNIPNPLSNSASIGYNIPSNSRNVFLVINDMNGKTVKQLTVQAGAGVINIDASALRSGTYSYTLLIDGKAIATKKMVIAR